MTYIERFGTRDPVSEGDLPPHPHDAGDISGTWGVIRVRGDIYSTDWDGKIPADLTTDADTTATKGFYVDVSAGAAQFAGLIIMGSPAGGWIGLRESSPGYPELAFKLGTDSGETVPARQGVLGLDLDALALMAPGAATDGLGLVKVSSSADTADIFVRFGVGAVLVTLDGNGLLAVPGHVVPQDDNASDLGSAALSFRNLYAYGIYDEAGNLRVDLSAVSYGANDSGGAGYKVLRVPN